MTEPKDSAGCPARKPIAFLNLASVVSAMAVVFLHANGCFWNFSAQERYWRTANVIESVFYFAVPVFFMISGATLFDFYERYGLRDYFRKRAVKTLVPYVFWSLFGVLFQWLVTKTLTADQITIPFLVNGLLDGSLVAIYWFFIPLFCLYLSVPLFAAVPRDRRRTLFTYLAVVGFLLNVLIPFVVRISGLAVSTSLSVAVTGGYLLYPIVGYLLTNGELRLPLRLVIYGTGAAGLAAHAIGTQRLSLAAGEIVSTYKGYVNVPCVLYSVAVFVLMRYGGERLMRHPRVARAVNALAGYTFPLYLLHWYVLRCLIGLFSIDTRSIVYRLGAPFLALAAVVGITWMIRRIPVLRKLLP